MISIFPGSSWFKAIIGIELPFLNEEKAKTASFLGFLPFERPALLAHEPEHKA
jgi:hypothetical protein